VQDIRHITETIASLQRDGDARELTARLQDTQRSTGDLKHAVREFESILLVRLFEEMKRAIPEGGLLNDPTCKQMNDLFWYYLAQDLAAKGGLGVADELYRQVARQTRPQMSQGTTEQLL